MVHFGPNAILAWTAPFVNCHIALKTMFYLLNIVSVIKVFSVLCVLHY